MPISMSATRFGKHQFSFSYEATPEQMQALAEEAIANGIKSAICAGIKGKRAAIDDRDKASAEQLVERFPTEVRDVKVALAGNVGAWTPSAPKDPVAALQAAVTSGSLTADQIAELKALLG